MYDFHKAVNGPDVRAVSPLVGPLAGGTLVVLSGTRLSTNATVMFVERSLSGALTGLQRECGWRDLPGMSSTSTQIR
jgi:hypothetical protein